MAPERLADLPFDARADLFSAGVFLYEALCGRRLFPGVAPGTVVDSLFDARGGHAAVAPQSATCRPRSTPSAGARSRVTARIDFPTARRWRPSSRPWRHELGWSAERAARSFARAVSTRGLRRAHAGPFAGAAAHDGTTARASLALGVGARGAAADRVDACSRIARRRPSRTRPSRRSRAKPSRRSRRNRRARRE